MRSVWLALTLAAAGASPAATQQAPRVPHVFLGGGVEVLGFRDGSTVRPGLALVGGFQFATLAPRLGATRRRRLLRAHVQRPDPAGATARLVAGGRADLCARWPCPAALPGRWVRDQSTAD